MMSEQALDIQIRKKQLRFRAWHRGTREADLLLGNFADSYLPTCQTAVAVEAFAQLLEAEDPDLWDWVTEKKPVDPAFAGAPFDALLAYVKARVA